MVVVGQDARKRGPDLVDDRGVARPVVPSRLRTRIAVAALSTAAVLGIGVTADAGAQESVVIDDPRLDPSLAGVEVDSAGYRESLAAWRNASGRLADARTRLARARTEVDEMSGERDRLEAERAEAERRGAEARTERDRLKRSLRAVAVAQYVQGRGEGTDSLFNGAERASEIARQESMVDDVAERRTAQVRAAQAVVDEADGVVERDTALLGDLELRLAEAIDLRDRTEGEVTGLERSVADARRSTADWRITANVSGSDLPLVALDAYVKAAGRMAAERPECGIRWWGLAGIGKVESGHGTYGGARLTAAGTTSQPIVGIPLDGANNTAVVGDTDGGSLDGDPTVDRAVGPMQFIPGSWVTLGRDGNGDGRADPSNIYDAALAAAGLLCRSAGTGLDTDAGLRSGALAYNNSAAYADLVVRTARAYEAREAELIPPPPTTTTTEPPAAPEVPPIAPPAEGTPPPGAPAAEQPG